MRHYHHRSRGLMTRGIRPLRHNEFEVDVTPLLAHSIQYPIETTNRENELYSHRKVFRHMKEPI